MERKIKIGDLINPKFNIRGALGGHKVGDLMPIIEIYTDQSGCKYFSFGIEDARSVFSEQMLRRIFDIIPDCKILRALYGF